MKTRRARDILPVRLCNRNAATHDFLAVRPSLFFAAAPARLAGRRKQSSVDFGGWVPIRGGVCPAGGAEVALPCVACESLTRRAGRLWLRSLPRRRWRLKPT